MSLKLLSEINDRYHMGLRFHMESADLFCYLSLPGFGALHEHQLLEEMLMQRQLKKFIIRTYPEIIYDKIPQSANLLEPLTKNKLRNKLKSEQRWEIIKQAWHAYLTWEDDTLIEYERIAKTLSNEGNISEYAFIVNIVKSVKNELDFIIDTCLALDLMDWDLPQIISMQDTWLEKYEYQTRKIYKNYKIYHHYNSAIEVV